MKSSLQADDEAAAAAQKTPNRVALQDLESKIEDIEFYRPAVAQQVTIAIVKMKNGYVVTGESAPADPANFDEKLGKQFALENAKRKIWPLLGFALCEKLAA